MVAGGALVTSQSSPHDHDDDPYDDLSDDPVTPEERAFQQRLAALEELTQEMEVPTVQEGSRSPGGTVAILLLAVLVLGGALLLAL